MKKGIRVSTVYLCVTIVLTSMGVGLTAPAARITYANIWDGQNIYVDGVPIGVRADGDTSISPLLYKDSVYIPLFTAGEWLGAEAVCDLSDQTIFLRRGKAPYYHNVHATPDHLQTEINFSKNTDNFPGSAESLVEIELCPNMLVFLDGIEQSFADVNGEILFPILSKGAVYLPVRGVAAMCAKEILWLPSIPPTLDISTKYSFSELNGPLVSTGLLSMIHLYEKPTQTQLDNMQSYINDIDGKLYALANTADNFDQNIRSAQNATTHLLGLEAYLDAIQDVPARGMPLFDWASYDIQRTAEKIKTNCLCPYLNSLSNNPEAIKDTAANDMFSQAFFVGLSQLRTLLTSAQNYVGAMQSQRTIGDG